MNMEFNSQICTSVEQSKRLLELGLKPETADMSLTVVFGSIVAQWVGELNNLGEIKINSIKVPNEEIENTPAWSLHRLLEMISKKDCEEHYYFDLSIDYDSIKDVYDSIIEVIERHIKEKFFNKEYLKGGAE